MTTSDRRWFTALGAASIALAAVDVWRGRCQDDTTLSCGVRRLVGRVPAGRYLFAAGLAATSVGFYDHIVGPLTSAVADNL